MFSMTFITPGYAHFFFILFKIINHKTIMFSYTNNLDVNFEIQHDSWIFLLHETNRLG